MGSYKKLASLVGGLLILILSVNVWAGPIYLQMIDRDGDGRVNFKVTSISYDIQLTYTFGITSKDHLTTYFTQLLSPGSPSIVITAASFEPGIYDLYLASGTTTYWLSAGDATLSITNNNSLAITTWSNSPVINSEFASDDQFAAVPIPPTIWLLSSGMVVVEIIRKKRKILKITSN